MPKAHPKEFRDDVVAVARKGDATLKQMAKNFGISEAATGSTKPTSKTATAQASPTPTRRSFEN